MIASEVARQLRDAGLVWHPAAGDFFRLDGSEFSGDETFTISDMTVESHEFDTGTILGFNGTTEWALDSVALEQALWVPREDQLRTLLGEAFVSLQAAPDDRWRVTIRQEGEPHEFEAHDAESAYAAALLAAIDVSARR
ncbi:hypothetical protein ACFOYW_06825 [Gryllotalpicola reticulitermitis]|uniref:Pilus assembly protein CpaE n=1 Tax=Gryllotalpicola reticulitermitis TaxID=1184153 RepID=A0ABV8Q6G9_9MICO